MLDQALEKIFLQLLPRPYKVAPNKISGSKFSVIKQYASMLGST